MTNYLKFTDFNFKLAVLEVLMYDKEVFGEPFRIEDFAESQPEIDVERDGYAPIPQALAYFRELQIPAEHAALIEEIYMDGGNEIYFEICPYWDGEDAAFDLTSADDADLFPNLKKVTVMGSGDALLEAFRAKGIAAEWL
ncbi:MAG: hypothetical protein AAGN35_09995 [Bacteroidota bacterium]